MARVTVEDCLKHKVNRFELIMDASYRARQLAMRAAEPGVQRENDKETVIALREIAAGMTDLAAKEDARIRGLDQADFLASSEDV